MPSNEFDSLISSAFAESIGVVGESFIYGNQSLHGVVSELTLEQSSEMGGLSQDAAISVVTPGNRPFQVGESIIYQGKTYRIEKVSKDMAGHELICVSAGSR